MTTPPLQVQGAFDRSASVFRRIARLSVCAVAGVIGLAAVLKAVDLSAFVTTIESHGLVSGGPARFAALAVVVAEAALASMVLFNVARRWACVTIAAMLVVFIVYMTVVYLREGEVSCNCFGGYVKLQSARDEFVFAMVRNGALLGLLLCAGLLARLPSRSAFRSEAAV